MLMQQNKCHIFVLSSKLLFYYLFIEHQASVGGSGKNSKIKVHVMGLHFLYMSHEKNSEDNQSWKR